MRPARRRDSKAARLFEVALWPAERQQAYERLVRRFQDAGADRLEASLKAFDEVEAASALGQLAPR